jgi:hypothetical protein
VGSKLCYWLIIVSRKIVARRTAQDVILDNNLNRHIKESVESFDFKNALMTQPKMTKVLPFIYRMGMIICIMSLFMTTLQKNQATVKCRFRICQKHGETFNNFLGAALILDYGS